MADSNIRLAGYLAGTAPRKAVVQGNYAYVAEYSGLGVVDISNPAHPRRVGSLITPGPAQSVTVSGNYAYVADDREGLWIIDVSNPANPVAAGNSTYANFIATEVALKDQYAYVSSDYDPGFQIYDVSNPNNPVAIPMDHSQWHYWASSLGIKISGNYAYSSCMLYLGIFDISNPYATEEVGWIETEGFVNHTAIKGGYAYIANGSAGITIVNVSNPSNPTIVKNIPDHDYAKDIATNGNYAYVADGDAGLMTLDISHPASSVETSVLDTPGFANGVSVDGHYVYLTDSSPGGLRIFDIGNPAQPVEYGHCDPVIGPLNACAVALQGNYAYVASFGLHVINISNPSAMTDHAVDLGRGEATNIAISGHYAYIAADYGGLRVVDISNPASAAEVGSYLTGYPNYKGVAVQGDCAYVAESNPGKLDVFDITDPTHPDLLGNCDVSGNAYDVAVAGTYACIAAGNAGLRIMDISTPAAPSEAGNYDTPGSAESVAIDGNHAYIADGDHGLCIVDITQPSSPVLVSTFFTSGPAQGVFIQGSYACVAMGAQGMVMVDIHDPSHPSAYNTYDTPGTAQAVAAQGNFVYAADGTGGLQVLKYGAELSSSTVSAMQNKKVIAYPNPGKGLIHFAWSEPNASNIKINIYNLIGERIATLNAATSGRKIDWNSTGIAPGIYLYRVALTVDGSERQLPIHKLAIVR